MTNLTVLLEKDKGLRNGSIIYKYTTALLKAGTKSCEKILKFRSSKGGSSAILGQHSSTNAGCSAKMACFHFGLLRLS